jgi:23S rRNA (uracil1939-C5)-methyltransferase
MPEKTRVFMVEGMEVNPIVSNFEVTVEKLIYGGDGLARLDGRVVFAPYVLPGERIRAQAEREKPGLVRARTLEVLDSSTERVAPPCPYFTRCGGCHYQHAGYEYQLAAKREILIEELRRLGKIEPPAEIQIVSGEPWGYRNRVQLHLDGGRLGYWESHSHKLCRIETCPVASPKLIETIASLNRMLHDPRWPRFVKSIEIFTDEQHVQLNILEADRPVAHRFFEWCAEKIDGFAPGPLDYGGRFRVSANSFFQVNRHLVDRLVELAVAGAEGETALDLYAGVGLFSMALGGKFREVIAVESGSAAVRDLQFNAERAGLANVTAAQQMVEEYLVALEQAPDFVLADPPRAGLGKDVVRRLGELQPRQIAIVSCDPATLARDVAGLLVAGYRIAEMTLVDLFPQTFHLETVVRLVR